MPTHLRSLTSLRFFAAALVALYHAAIQSAPDGIQPFAVLRFGYLGVTFFFVLSGFVLVWSARDGDSSPAFYRRRFARVWPLHALMFTAAIALGLAGLVDHRGTWWSAPLNLGLLQGWFYDPELLYGFNGVSWSLSAEAFFYLMFPLLYLLGRRVGAVPMLAIGSAWLIVGALLAEASNAFWLVQVFPAYRIGEFAVGMGLALLVRAGTAPRISTKLATGALLGSYAAAIVLNRVSAGELGGRQWWVALIVLPGIAIVLLAFAGRDIAGDGGWLVHPVLVRLGQWSFALYLVHELVLRTARPLMVEHAWMTVVALVGAVALSGALYEWFERPLEKRLRGGRARPAVQLEPAGK